MSSRRSGGEPLDRRSVSRGASAWAPFGAFGLALILALAAGCQPLCVRHSDCPLGYICRPDGLCDLPPAPPAPDAEPDGPPGQVPDLPDGSLGGTDFEDDAAAELDAGLDAATDPADAG